MIAAISDALLLACSAPHSELRARLTKHASGKKRVFRRMTPRRRAREITNMEGTMVLYKSKLRKFREERMARYCLKAELRLRNKVRDDDREQCRRRHTALKYQIEEVRCSWLWIASMSVHASCCSQLPSLRVESVRAQTSNERFNRCVSLCCARSSASRPTIAAAAPLKTPTLSQPPQLRRRSKHRRSHSHHSKK